MLRSGATETYEEEGYFTTTWNRAGSESTKRNYIIDHLQFDYH